MQSGRNDKDEEDTPLKIGKLTAPQSGEKWMKERGILRMRQKDISQSPSPFMPQSGSSLGWNNETNQGKYIDIEYGSIEAERAISKRINQDSFFYPNSNTPSQQWNEAINLKIARDAAAVKSPIDRNNLIKTQTVSRKQQQQQSLNSSFDASQYSKKTNNFLNIDNINYQKQQQKRKMQDKRVRANLSLNGSPAGKKNHFNGNSNSNSQQNNILGKNQNQQSRTSEMNNTISVNDIINTNNTSHPLAATKFNNNNNNTNNQNNDSQIYPIKTFTKLIETNQSKARHSFQDIQEFPQIGQSNKSSQSHFDRILKSKPSVASRVNPKILQENIINVNSSRNNVNLNSINIRRKSSLIGSEGIANIDDYTTLPRRDTSHQSKENGIRGITNDESGDDLSFEGRYKQKQNKNIRKKLQIAKQPNGGGFKIYAEKEDLMFKTGLITNQRQIGSNNESSSPTYNVETATSRHQKQINGVQQQFNQYLSQQPIVSQINTNKAHTKLRLEEIKNTYAKGQQQHQQQSTNNSLQNNLKQQILYINEQRTEKQSNKQSALNKASLEKSRFSNLKINTRQEDIILEDENDGTITINEEDIKLKVSKLTHLNSTQQVILDQSFQVLQNKNLEEDLENWREENDSLKINSISAEEDNYLLRMQEKDIVANLANRSIQLENKLKFIQKDSFQEEEKNVCGVVKNPLQFQNKKDKIQKQMEENNKYLGISSSLSADRDDDLKGYIDANKDQQQSIRKSSSFYQSSKGRIMKEEIIEDDQNYSQLEEFEEDDDDDDDDIKKSVGKEIQVNMQIQSGIQKSQIVQAHSSSDESARKEHKQQKEQQVDKFEEQEDSIMQSQQLMYTKKGSTAKKEVMDDIYQQHLIQLQNSQTQQFDIISADKGQCIIINKDLEKQEENENTNIIIVKKQFLIESYIDSQDQHQNHASLLNESSVTDENSQNKLQQICKITNSERTISNLQEDDILKKIDFETIILWEQNISEISSCFKSQNATKCFNSVVNYCSQYLILMRQRNFDNLSTLLNDEKLKRIIQNQIILERLGMIVLLHNFLDRKMFMNNINNIRNIVSYIHLNFILFIDLLLSKVQQSHPSLINQIESRDSNQCQSSGVFVQNYSEYLMNMVSFVKEIAAQNIYRKKTSKPIEFIQVIKCNNEILLNLYRNTTKHDKEFYNHIQSISKTIEKTQSIQETFILILNIFALYLTVLENIIGHQPLPFLAVCPAPYLPPLQVSQQQQTNEGLPIKKKSEEGGNSSENNNYNDAKTLETCPKEEKSNQDSVKISEIISPEEFKKEQLNKQQTQNINQKDPMPNKRQRSVSKSLAKGSNNSTISRSTTPNSHALSNNVKSGTIQLDKFVRKPSPPPPLATAGPLRRKSSSFANSNSSNNIQNNKEKKINKKSHDYTLVLDLDETLVHYSEISGGGGGQFVIRPFAQQFLETMAEHYEIVVFTAAMPDYANWVLDNLDPNKFVSYRLFRQHAVHIGNVFIKDLSRLGRSLEKTIIIDNVADNFQLQPENGIFIKGWFSDPYDTALSELLPLLKEMVVKNVPDVRKALKSLKEQMIQNIQNGLQYPHLNLKLD